MPPLDALSGGESVDGGARRHASVAPDDSGGALLDTGRQEWAHVTAGHSHDATGAGSVTTVIETAVLESYVLQRSEHPGAANDAGARAAFSGARDGAEEEQDVGAWPAELSGAAPLRVSLSIRPASGSGSAER